MGFHWPGALAGMGGSQWARKRGPLPIGEDRGDVALESGELGLEAGLDVAADVGSELVSQARMLRMRPQESRGEAGQGVGHGCAARAARFWPSR